MPDQEDVETERKGKETYAGAVSGAEATVDHGEEERRGNTGGVTDGEMHTGGKRTLSIAGVVGGDPGEGDTGADKDTDGDEAAACVRGSVAVLRDEHTVADYGGDDTTNDEVASALGNIGETGADDVDDGTNSIDRDGHGLDLGGRPGSHGLDDGGEEDDEGVEHGQEREESEAVGPGGPVFDAVDDIGLDELSHVAGLAELNVVDLAKVFLVLVGEELCSIGAVGQNEGNEKSSKDGGGTVDEDNPSPGTPAASTIEEADAIGDKTTGNTRGSGSSVKVCDPQSETSTAVEHGKVQNDTGEETSFAKTEEKTTDDKTSQVLDPGAEGSDDSPGEGETGEVA